jgi:DNA-binding response OmpR family regulator
MPARILVLDDEPAIRALVARASAEEGYEVVTVANGLLGLSAMAVGHFDLVITNCMPGMSGPK